MYIRVPLQGFLRGLPGRENVPQGHRCIAGRCEKATARRELDSRHRPRVVSQDGEGLAPLRQAPREEVAEGQEPGQSVIAIRPIGTTLGPQIDAVGTIRRGPRVPRGARPRVAALEGELTGDARPGGQATGAGGGAGPDARARPPRRPHTAGTACCAGSWQPESAASPLELVGGHGGFEEGRAGCGQPARGDRGELGGRESRGLAG